MHEMSLCESIIQIIEEQAVAQPFKSVSKVRLEVGTLSGVEPKAMQFSYDVVTKGTVAENSILEIIECPAMAWCMVCAESVEIKQTYDACPKCGSHQLQVSSGSELRIKDMEVV